MRGFQAWLIQRQRASEDYMAIMSNTMSTDITTAETVQTSITMVGVEEQALANSRLLLQVRVEVEQQR